MSQLTVPQVCALIVALWRKDSAKDDRYWYCNGEEITDVEYFPAVEGDPDTLHLSSAESLFILNGPTSIVLLSTGVLVLRRAPFDRFEIVRADRVPFTSSELEA